jgi:23S rRNA pseudouridine1911/1915/1917 synthase
VTSPPGEAAGEGLVRRVVLADRGDAGVRIDRVLLRRLADVPGISRTRIQRWIEAGLVTVGGRCRPRVSARVAAGEQIAVTLPAPTPRRVPTPEPGRLDVLFEDAGLLALDKPPGLVVHPSYRHASGTLLNAVLGRAAAEGWTPRLVHRLDKQTSGVLLVAKTLDAHRALVRAWASGAVRKHYLAVTWGAPPRPRGEIRLALGRDPLDRRRVTVVTAGGRDSRTRYEVLARSRGLRAGVSLLHCELLTGRMHQVRVHLAAAGCPIVGDRVYGPARPPHLADARLAEVSSALARQALHAWRLDLALDAAPARTLEAPVPADLRALLDAAGIDDDGLLARRA